MKSILTILLFISTSSFSQTWEWAKKFGAAGSDIGFNINTDSKENLYITGSFEDTVMFGTTQLFSKGAPDMFFAKLDSSGNVIWAQGYGGIGYDYGIEILPDSIGN